MVGLARLQGRIRSGFSYLKTARSSGINYVANPLLLIQVSLTSRSSVIADDFHGKISLSSKQIDGNGKVLFPNDNSWVRVSNSSGQYHEKPADTLIIDPSSSDHKIATPKPIGYTYYGYSLIYPNPGCYRFTASDGNGSIDMIIEVKN